MKRFLILPLLLMGAGTATAISVTISVQKQPACTYNNGRLRANPSGGVPPYTYAWSNGSTDQQATNLGAGDYSVTVTDANMEQATAAITLTAGDLGNVLEIYQDWFNYGNGLCTTGPVKVGFDPLLLELPGPPPYYVNGVELMEEVIMDPDNPGYYMTIYSAYMDNVQYGQTNIFPFEDGNGCPGTYPVSIGWPVQWPQLTAVSIQGACAGTTSGSITMSSTGEGHQQGVQAQISPGGPTATTYNAGGGPSTFTISGLAAGSYTLDLFMSVSSFLPSSQCGSSFSFTIPQLGADCGTVSGKVFIDHDQDCVQDPGEPGVPNLLLELQPGPQYFFTDATGAYHRELTNGSYTLAQADPTLVQLCPAQAPAPFTLNWNPVVLTLADSSTVPLDLSANLQATPMRPGFLGAYWGRVRNLSSRLSGAVTVTMEIDPSLIYLGATPVPNDVTGNTVTWDLSAFGPFQYRDFTVDVQVPPGTPLGTVLGTSLNVDNALGDAEPGNNLAALDVEVVGSYDPNDKRGITNATKDPEQFILGQDQWIDYTIRFQNTGTDTAFTVVVRDELSEDLAIGTLDILGASHDFVPSFGEGRELVFTFNDILLPDSTTDLLGSQGFVSFRIRPVAGIQVGDVIQNTAGIYFDFNEPVITNTTEHTVSIGTGVEEATMSSGIRVHPNPTNDILYVHLSDGADQAVRVFAVDGRAVEVPGRNVANGLELDVRTLSPGTYLLHIPGGVARFVKW